MARKTLARNPAPASGGSRSIDQNSAAIRKLHATYADQTVEALRNSSPSRHEMAIQLLRQPE
jgi:hypothetical protein